MDFVMSPRRRTVRVKLRLSPYVATVALLRSQGDGLELNRWVERAVVERGEKYASTTDALRFRDRMVIELFAHVASFHPEALTGRWKTLRDICVQDEALWRAPTVTMCEAKKGLGAEPTIDVRVLSQRWSELVARAWPLDTDKFKDSDHE